MAADDGAPPGTPPAKGGISLRSPLTWVIILGVAVGGGGYILWKRSRTAAAAQAPPATGASTDQADFAGQIGTLQTEIMNLQDQLSADHDTTGTPAGPAKPATAPIGLSATPHRGTGGQLGFADFGWGKVTGATTYNIDVQGAGGAGTGTTNVARSTGADNHAEHVELAQGKYKWRVNAASSAGAGPWSGWASLTMAPSAKTRATQDMAAVHTSAPSAAPAAAAAAAPAAAPAAKPAPAAAKPKVTAPKKVTTRKVA
jgi:hypothetical protein